MSDGWRDFEPGRRGVSVAQLADGESVTAGITGEPYRRETAESDHALHVPVVFGDVPDGFEDMSGDAVQEGEEYNIINSSSAFFEALIGAFPEGADVAGSNVEITASQPGDDFTRTYTISEL